MKRLLFLMMVLATVCCTSAQNKSFKVGSTENYIWSYKFDGSFFIVLKHYDKDNNIPREAILKIRLADGKVLKLKGTECADNSSMAIAKGPFENSGTFNTSHLFLLPVTKEQLLQMKTGISAMAINTIPNVEKTSTGANFGEIFYNSFMSLKDDFEE